MTRWLAALLLLAGQDDPGLKVPPGFKVTLYADHEIANDVYAMTLDSQGRVVVTSQGWIKTLHDTDGDGKADRASTFAETRTGGMGLCFDGNDLYFSGDNGFWRYRDADGDGKADGPPERLGRFTFGEHGHHAMRKGPDGGWYLIAGNDAAVNKSHVTLETSPVRNPETGALLRYTPDGTRSEVIAHGFRNPYDFDFNEAGDLFAYDSDCERDYFLPWYTPTRVYHVGYGLHHGWRLTGYLRSFCRLDFYPDNVDVLWPIGRGSPTGVACYRHDRFPERYRGGVFALDWTFGRIYFLPLRREGAGYATKAEVFIEPTGTHGFAPSDVAVAPDGALFISIGGRRTRGAVYKVEYVGPPAPRRPAPAGDLDRVLAAPQPLDAWSRARWEPLARKLGREPFLGALADEKRDEASRVRAVEVLTELFGGVPAPASKSGSARVRARVAWSLGRAATEEFSAALLEMARDNDAAVRRAALESLADRVASIQPPDRLNRRILLNFEHPDKRVRQAAVRLAAALPEPGWDAILLDRPKPQVLLSWTLAAIWRGEPLDRTVEPALHVLEKEKNAAIQLQAARLIVLALGDCNLAKPPVELHSNYSLPGAVEAERAARILKAVRPVFPSGDPRLDLEASRLQAMLEDDEPETVPQVAAFLDDKSSATSDVHYLTVLSRLRGAWPDDLAAKVAGALLSLSRKLEGQEQRTKQTWGTRLTELTGLLVKRDGRLDEELLKNPAFAAPGHVDIAAALEGERKTEGARKFLEAARAREDFPWSEALIGLLARLPAEEFHPVLRAQWPNFGLRDAVLLHLSRRPDPADRDKFLAGVESAHAQAAQASIDALEKLPRDETPKNLLPLLRLLRRLVLEPKQATLRKEVLALVNRQAGQSFAVKEEAAEPVALKAAYQPVFDWFGSAHPEFKAELAGEGEDPAALRAALGEVPWEKGDAARGESVFRARGCQTCHAVQGALGPSLAGAATRFSREDLFDAIANPSRDVAPLYRTTLFQLKDGQVHSGIVAFESADGYMVQTGATTTVRINTSDIAAVRPGTSSLMPNGLLQGLKPGDLADLYAYLRSVVK